MLSLWPEELLCPIYKSGDCLLCENRRWGIIGSVVKVDGST